MEAQNTIRNNHFIAICQKALLTSRYITYRMFQEICTTIYVVCFGYIATDFNHIVLYKSQPYRVQTSWNILNVQPHKDTSGTDTNTRL